MFDQKTVLITGGTGSFGKAFTKKVLNSFPGVKKIIIFSRDELKQYEMSSSAFFKEHEEKLRFFIGDVRDENRLKMACENVDIVIHAAAMKQVPAAEYNPFECILTNVIGAKNVVNAALHNNVETVVALSTDKAAAPINLYGATKLCSDKLIIAANHFKGARKLKLSVVRYGNVLGSRGSVVPFFLKLAKEKGEIPITDERMTRFNISIDDGVQMVFDAVEKSWGGELYVPKIPSYRILDIANAIAPSLEKKNVGIRPGEKLHEEMITETDALSTVDCGSYFVILPSVLPWDKKAFMAEFNAKPVSEGFKFNSGTNEEWLNIDEIRSQIKEHVDPEFEVV